MQHLTLEDLARLVDEPPSAAEAAHVRDCLVCRRELDEMRAQTGALAALGGVEPPAHAWAALEGALRAEGLVRDLPAAAKVTPLRPRPAAQPWLRAAAAVAVFLLGGAAGIAVWGRVAVDRAGGGIAEGPAQGQPLYASGPRGGGGSVPVSTLPGEDPLILIEDAPEPVAGARLASEGAPAPRRPRTAAYPSQRVLGREPAPAPVAAPPAAVSRAEVELVEAQAAYLAALQRYARAVDEVGEDDPEARLAALERLVRATGAALDRAPADPVINGYHLAALRERDEMRRRIANSQQKNWF